MPVILDEKFVETKTVNRDTRGRVTIGLEGASRQYILSRNSCGQILLTPVAQLPIHEIWLHQNPDALASVQRGLKDETEGRVNDMGSFAEFAVLPINE